MKIGYSIEKRGNTYRVIVSDGFDANGRRKRFSETLPPGTTKQEANKRGRELATTKDRGLQVDASRQSIAAYLRQWLNSREGSIAQTTLQGYTGYVERRIIPAIGTISLSKLTPDNVETMEQDLMKKGLSPTSVAQIHRILHKALKDALRRELIIRNVADVVEPPKKSTPEMRPMTPEELGSLIDATVDHPMGALFHLDAQTGLRRSELCGLRWSDLDLDIGMLQVQRTVQRVKGQGLVVMDPKTKKSKRKLPIGSEAIQRMKQHRAVQAEARLYAGPAWFDGDYVFTRPNGRPLDPDTVSHAFHKVILALGLDGVRLHDTRHTHATILFNQGIPLRTIQDRLGHSTIATTSDIYTHTEPGQQDDAAKAIDEAISVAKQRAS